MLSNDVLHYAKFGLLAAGIFAGMCGGGVLLAAIVFEKLLKPR